MDANPDDFSAVPVLATLRFFRTRSRTSTQKCNDASQRPGLNFLALKGTEPQSHSMQISQVRVQKRYYAIFEVRRAGSEARLRSDAAADRAQHRPSQCDGNNDRTRSHVRTIQKSPCITRGIHTWECDLMQFQKKFGKANVTSLVSASAALPCFCATMTGNRGRS